MINQQKVHNELMKAVERTRDARVEARKHVEAAMAGASPQQDVRLRVKDTFRAHAFATTAHNIAVRELREYHLRGTVPSHLEYLAVDTFEGLLGTLLARTPSVAM